MITTSNDLIKEFSAAMKRKRFGDPTIKQISILLRDVLEKNKTSWAMNYTFDAHVHDLIIKNKDMSPDQIAADQIAGQFADILREQMRLKPQKVMDGGESIGGFYPCVRYSHRFIFIDLRSKEDVNDN